MLDTDLEDQMLQSVHSLGLNKGVTWCDAYRAIEVGHKGGDVWREACEAWR